MKTTKLVLSIIGVALATISFGQHISLHEISSPTHHSIGVQLNYHSDVLFYSADFNEEQGRMEHWLYNIPGLAYQLAFTDNYEAPDISRAYFVKDVEINLGEEALLIENWMTTPFESALTESEIWMESWMITPFDEYQIDKVLQLESWMVIPFEVEESI